MTTWKTQLEGRIDEAWARGIDEFDTLLALRRQGKVDEKLFAEARLRRGAYGQRYDNGQRHDGEQSRVLSFPSGPLTKGPETMWDAPGMHRIKIPMGKLSSEQLDVLSDCAEEYSDGILHVTTRQDFQLHFVHIDDTPDLMRRLGAVGITTQEACGNQVRNVCACPIAGVCADEAFDVTPYANAIVWFLMGHPDTMEFGRKFKIAFSGCAEKPCGLVNFHDLGFIARRRPAEGGGVELGFDVYVGGGLGAVPMDAQLLAEFVSPEEMLPLTQAACRVFGRLGEKANRSRARVKFLVKKLGIEEFRRLTFEERAQLLPDPRWTAYLDDLDVLAEAPVRPGAALPEGVGPDGFALWRSTNVQPQRQEGYYFVTVTAPLGDITSDQGRALADLARAYTGDAMRTTVEQNLAFRWVSGADVIPLYERLQQMGLAEPGANAISDVVACPGTDTCKLGISASRGLGGELRERLSASFATLPESVRGLHIKASGCFNSCSQHHAADLGFLGVSRTVKGRRVPHFQVVLGGQWEHNAGAYGLPLAAIPSKRVPEAVERLTQRFAAERQGQESFREWVTRIGKGEIKTMLEDLRDIPTYEEDASFYSDWGDPREYTTGDMGTGECAGEVVPAIEFALQAAEQHVFEAQLHLDRGENEAARQQAYQSMLAAAKGLVRHVGAQVLEEPQAIVDAFRTHLHEPGHFRDKYAKDKFAHYFFRAHEEMSGASDASDRRAVHTFIDETQLFVEAAHACYQRLAEQAAARAQGRAAS